MKKLLRFAAVLFLMFFAHDIKAQCSFTATITPSSPILCPEGTDTLSTQVYDSYQWYKNGHAIAGATNRTYIVAQDDILYAFKVAATKDGCTDTSKRVIVDGYVFNPPIIIETGDIGIYDPQRDTLIECPGDTLILTLGNTYTVNLQWYNNFNAIKGANEQSYYVTKDGSYTVCGAPEVCPNYIVCENLPVNAIFENPTATVTQSHDTLFASSARHYQWFLNNRKIAGATLKYYVPLSNGKYKVATADKYKCIAVSDPYFYTATNSNNIISVSPNPVIDILHVHVQAKDAKQIVISDLYGDRVVQTSATANDQNISLQNIRAGTYLLQVLNSQKQIIASTTIIKE